MPESSSSKAARPTDSGLANCRVHGSVATDKGPCRASNEDSGVLFAPVDPEQLNDKGVLLIVADGMGGHQGGEVASEMATRLVSELYYADPSDPQEALLTAFRAANRAVFERARSELALTGMGTTCTAVATVDGLAYCAHVGDSRAYLVRAGQIYSMTEDHSATMALVREGLLTLDEARAHEDRNIILRAMGTRPDLNVSSWPVPFPLRPDDRIVLCSDGLYDIVSDPEICVIAGAQAPHDACRKLLRLAVERVSSDNVTVGILHAYSSGEISSARAPEELLT